MTGQLIERRTNGILKEPRGQSNGTSNNNGNLIKSQGLQNEYSKTQVETDQMFVPRPSLITQLGETDQNFNAITGIFVNLLYTLILVTIVEYIRKPERLESFFRYWGPCFQGFFPQGVCVILSSWISYFIIWMAYCTTDSKLLKLLIGLPGITMLTVFPAYMRWTRPIGSITANCICCEQLRTLMKVWALTTDNSSLPLGNRATLSEAVYFYFAPTFVYRKSYPRTNKVDLKLVGTWIFKFVTIILAHLIMVAEAIDIFLTTFVQSIAQTGQINMSQAAIGLMLTFYTVVVTWFILFHVWLNLWAEILRFADRQFYTDWWSSRSMQEFFRTWNIPVFMFLRTYLRRPLQEKGTRGNASRFISISVSFLLHEYMSLIIVRQVLPFFILMVVLFAVTFPFKINLYTKKHHSYIATLLFASNMLYMMLHTIEAKYRQLCGPLGLATWIDPFAPYFVICPRSKVLESLEKNI